MATRFKAGSRSNYGVSPLPTGYETAQYGPVDLYIPPCGIEDVDTAMFNLFDKEISPECGGKDSAPLKKAPIIFAAGEKWALLKKGRPIRDRNNTLILPLITIVRTEVAQQPTDDVSGRGINQHVGEIVIKRRLDKSDRDYQNLINKILLGYQQNVPNTEDNVVNQVETARDVGSLRSDPDIKRGAYLKSSLKNNVYETIVVPTPQFYTVKYQVTVWTQYMQHTNQIIERIISSFLPQGQSWRLDTPKGYWFVASLDGGNFENETNFDDMSQQERFIKTNFTVSVPAYIFASDAPGNPVPVKRYVSSPTVKFETTDDSLTDSDFMFGSDDPTLPIDDLDNTREDQRPGGWRLQKIYPNVTDAISKDVQRKVQGETIVTDASERDALKILLFNK